MKWGLKFFRLLFLCLADDCADGRRLKRLYGFLGTEDNWVDEIFFCVSFSCLFIFLQFDDVSLECSALVLSCVLDSMAQTWEHLFRLFFPDDRHCTKRFINIFSSLPPTIVRFEFNCLFFETLEGFDISSSYVRRVGSSFDVRSDNEKRTENG